MHREQFGEIQYYGSWLPHHEMIQPLHLVVDEKKIKLKATLICFESCSCDFIEIHGKSAKYIYVDESPKI